MTSPADLTERLAANVRICSVCSTVSEKFLPGGGGRPDALCRYCESLERHRGLALVLDLLTPFRSEGGVALEVAPSQMFRERLQRSGHTYVGLDFDPGADGRTVNVQASLTDAPLADASVDIGIVYHVLEHIPDDHAAMREIARIVNPNGVILMQVPWRRDQVTEEDLSITDPDERTRRYGQADHVRFYGTDLDDRLRSNGLGVVRLEVADIFGKSSLDLFALQGGPIWILAATQTVADGYAASLRNSEPGISANAIATVVESAAQIPALRASNKELGLSVRQRAQRKMRRLRS